MQLNQIKKQLSENPELVFNKLGIEYEVFSDNIYCICPAHEGSDNPRGCSFSKKLGIWKCWTKGCQEEYGNDIFGLIKGTLSKNHAEKIEFKNILKWITKEFKLRSDYKKQDEVSEDSFQSTINIFKKSIESQEEKEIEINHKYTCPSEYFLKRGFAEETLLHFGIGDCNDKTCMNNRSIIPIHNDVGNKIVGVIGRSTNDYKIPKFLIHPVGFDKRYYMYNFHRAIPKAIETNCLFITEGQGDVWKMYEAGVCNCVSVFGKTITEQHLSKLNKFPITHLIILMDNDQAGRESKIQIKRNLSRSYTLTFPTLNKKDVGEMRVKEIKSSILNNLTGTF